MANKFEIVGLQDFINDIEDFTKNAQRDLVPYVDQAGDVLLKEIKANTPTDTGALKESLYHKRPRLRKGVTRKIVTWGNDVRDYEAAVELGHNLVFFSKPTFKHIPETAFMRKSTDNKKEKVFKMLIIGIGIVMKKLGDDK